MNPELALAVVMAALAGAAYLAALVYGMVQILRTGGMTPVERAVWVSGFLFSPVIAAVVWFAAGPHPFGLRAGTPAFL